MFSILKKPIRWILLFAQNQLRFVCLCVCSTDKSPLSNQCESRQDNIICCIQKMSCVIFPLSLHYFHYRFIFSAIIHSFDLNWIWKGLFSNWFWVIFLETPIFFCSLESAFIITGEKRLAWQCRLFWVMLFPRIERFKFFICILSYASFAIKNLFLVMKVVLFLHLHKYNTRFLINEVLIWLRNS